MRWGHKLCEGWEYKRSLLHLIRVSVISAQPNLKLHFPIPFSSYQNLIFTKRVIQVAGPMCSAKHCRKQGWILSQFCCDWKIVKNPYVTVNDRNFDRKGGVPPPSVILTVNRYLLFGITLLGPMRGGLCRPSHWTTALFLHPWPCSLILEPVP